MHLEGKQKLICLFLFIFLYPVVVYIYINKTSSSIIKSIPIQTKTILPQVNKIERVLILYVWADIDVQCLGNLQLFIRHAVHPSQQADYYFILQKVNNKPVNESRLPPLPPNAHYIQHENVCYDLGTFGWFLSQNIVNTTLYKYFIFMNSSVRGPFFVTYFDSGTIWWFTVFTERLNDEIKLIGPSISCEKKPHVQSYLMVTDQVGLSILTDKKSGVFTCKKDYSDAVVNGEIAASQLLLRANYQIASLQSKYQGWNFRKKENWNCNNRVSPIYYDRRFDGISHDPYEILFVKYKGLPQSFDTDLERRALIYQKWLDERPRKNDNKSTNIG